MTPAPPPDFFDDDFKTVMKLILKTSMTSFQLCMDHHALEVLPAWTWTWSVVVVVIVVVAAAAAASDCDDDVIAVAVVGLFVVAAQ